MTESELLQTTKTIKKGREIKYFKNLKHIILNSAIFF